MKGRVIITGASSGIGREAALRFAAEGYRVIMACRNLDAGEPVRREISIKTRNTQIDLLPLDMSSRQSILAFCRTYQEKYGAAEILIHNAGHFRHWEKRFQRSADGMELTSAVNLYGPVLMTYLLADALAQSDRPIVLNACSTNIKHFFDERRKIDFHALQGREIPGKIYDSYKLYGDSKMGLLMATGRMAQELKERGICVNAIMIPATRMSRRTVRSFRSYWRILSALQTPFIQKTAVIGNAYFSICTSPRYQGVTGALINHRGQIVRAARGPLSFLEIVTGLKYFPPYAENTEAADQVWLSCMNFLSGGTGGR